MTTSNLNALDRYQQAVNMHGKQQVFEHDLMDRSSELLNVAYNIGIFSDEYYKTKDINTDAYEEQLVKGLIIISQLSTSLGIRLSDLAVKGVYGLKEGKI